MNWGSPETLPWLLLIIPMAALFIWLHRRRLNRFASLITTPMWSRLAPEWLPKRATGKLMVWLTAFLFFGIALARPQWGYTWREIKRSGLDIVVVVDTSRSMLATDLKPNRLQQAKWGIRDMLKQLKGDRVGIVVFAGTSYLECPLTSDHAALMMYVDDLNVGLVPRGGTAITDALQTAVKAFDAKSDSDKIIVLITDGEDTVDDPLKTIPDLKKKNIRLYAIGVGSSEGELIPVTDENGHESFQKDRSGKVVKTSLNEKLLTRLALSTGGAYVHASPGQFGVERLAQEEWSKLKQSTGDTQRLKMYEDRAGWFISFGAILLVCEAARSERRRRSSAS